MVIKQMLVILVNGMKKMVVIVLVVLLFLASPNNVSANGGVVVEPSQNEIEKLNNKIDALILSNNANGISGNIIGLANTQMQFLTFILAVVGIGIPVFAFFFRKEIQIIKDRAMLSVVNMENEVKKIKLSEKDIAKRKNDIDRLYSDFEKRLTDIDEKMKKLKSTEGGPKEKNRLAELEQEIMGLKRKLSQGIQPYTLNVSSYPGTASGYVGPLSTTTSTSMGSFGAISPSSATTTTVEPFYPSPSASPSPEPED